MKTKHYLIYTCLIALCTPQLSKGMETATVSCENPRPHASFSPPPISFIVHELNKLKDLIELKYSHYREELSKEPSEQHIQNITPNTRPHEPKLTVVDISSLRDSPAKDLVSALFHSHAPTATTKDSMLYDIESLVRFLTLKNFSEEMQANPHLPENFEAFYETCVDKPTKERYHKLYGSDVKISPKEKSAILQAIDVESEKHLTPFFQAQFERLKELLNYYKRSIRTYYNNDLLKDMLKDPEKFLILISPFALQKFAEDVKDWESYFALCGAEALTYSCAEAIQNFYIHLKRQQQYMSEKTRGEWKAITTLIEDFALLNRQCTKPKNFPIHDPDTTLAAQLLNQNAKHKLIPSIIPAFYSDSRKLPEIFERITVHYQLNLDTPLIKKSKVSLCSIAEILEKHKQSENLKNLEESPVYLSFPQYPMLDPMYLYNFVTQRRKLSIPLLSNNPDIFSVRQQQKDVSVLSALQKLMNDTTQMPDSQDSSVILQKDFKEEKSFEDIKETTTNTSFEKKDEESINLPKNIILQEKDETPKAPTKKLPFNDRPSLKELEELSQEIIDLFNPNNSVQKLVNILLDPETKTYHTENLRHIVEAFHGGFTKNSGTSHRSVYMRKGSDVLTLPVMGITLHGKNTKYEGEKAMKILRNIIYSFFWHTLYGSPYA